MKTITTRLIISLFCSILFWGCSSESDSSNSANSNEVILGKLELSSGWARPGAEGQSSGVYLTIHNGTASNDTLLDLSSEVANAVEIHESIENDDGTTSMRPAGKQVIRDGNKLELEPGGIHIMLMDLKRELAVGDSLSVSLEFARVGTKKITVPVQIQN